MLDESEWILLNDVLSSLYMQESLEDFSNFVFSTLKMLVPFTKSYLLLLDDSRKINSDKSFFYGFERNMINKYIQTLYETDYLLSIYDIYKETVVFKDSDILKDEFRTESKIYKQFFYPCGIPYGCGIMILNGDHIDAVLSFFRDKTMGDFSDHDVFILEMCKKHFQNIINFILKKNSEKMIPEKLLNAAMKRFSFSQRESQIIQLIAEGQTNENIGKILKLSLFTVKKHIYNIFNKSGVNSRTQLIMTILKTNN